MRNLGPVCERDLNAAGIFSAQDLIEHGPEAAFIKLLQGRAKLGKSTTCCNAAYLYALYGAIHDIDWREIPAEKKVEFKQLTSGLRASGAFDPAHRRR
jgi:hypothetical protein